MVDKVMCISGSVVSPAKDRVGDRGTVSQQRCTRARDNEEPSAPDDIAGPETHHSTVLEWQKLDHESPTVQGHQHRRN